jgi:[acyl-carrier-protein] S-malonyltransferase
MIAYIFPGQGAQFPGMGKDLYDEFPLVKLLFEEANEVLGFDIVKEMFGGSAESLKQTRVTQPAIFIHSVAAAKAKAVDTPDMVAGHSLGEFSALVFNESLSFSEGLKLVSKRATYMQEACEREPSTMAAVLGLADEIVEEICEAVDDIVVPANYNCPGQLVISGTVKGVEEACERMKEAGAKRAMLLPVGGAFHSPLMEPARQRLQDAIMSASFQDPICPVYQNFTARPATDAETIKENLVAQLTGPVRWTQSVRQMVGDGASQFIECGPGKVLQGLVRKIDSSVEARGV